MKNYTTFINRRKLLIQTIKQHYPQKKGIVLLFAGFECDRYAFRQDSSFYYLTGIEEPAVVLSMDIPSNNQQKLVADGTGPTTTLLVPNYETQRSLWAQTIVESNEQQAKSLGVDAVRHFGHQCRGYMLAPTCVPKEYEHLLQLMDDVIKSGGSIFTIYTPQKPCEQTLILDRLLQHKPEIKQSIIDISSFIASLRRTKSQAELELMYEAIDCTMQAHEGAAMRIEPELFEYQIQAAIEFVFKESGGSAAFPSIVGSGKNSTVLHYMQNNRQMKKGDLVVIDIGAELNYYCADLTRTYPVSGHFTDRQREVYDIVLETQEYIENIAKPGYWLSNADNKEKSLQHLAVAFLAERGYDKYFKHGISHFLGIDVHDVGSRAEPLKAGDVITIEPGIYIPQENIGIRIEDNYWITDKGAVCMSDELPKESYEIEQLMAGEFEEE